MARFAPPFALWLAAALLAATAGAQGGALFRDDFETGWLCRWSSHAATCRSPWCPPYEQSPLRRARTRQLAANPGNWIAVVEGATNGDEVLLAPGAYSIPAAEYAVQIDSQITLRGASGDRDDVVISGAGYGVGGEGLMIMAPNVTIASLTLRDIRNHAVSIKGELGAEAPHLYDLHLVDIGTQHVKSTGGGDGVAAGVVACSSLGYSPGGVAGDYIDAIDVHGGVGWRVRDNVIYNHWGDGTGCEVDDDCGTYAAGGGPPILFWNGSSGTIVERNRILDAFRGIALGFGSAHPGGAVRDNFFWQPTPGRPGATGWIAGDMGIQIQGGSNVVVEHNTVILGGDYPGAVEIWNSPNVTVRDNLLTAPTWNRGGSPGLAVAGNKSDATVADLVAPGDPHLDPGSAAVDFPTAVAAPSATHDLDGDRRPTGAAGRDVGCDEVFPAP
jgi:hypothetical protein